MINPTLPPIEINGITYDVEFNESNDTIILMSVIQDVEINASDLTSKAYAEHHYINDAGDDDCNDSDVTRFIEVYAEEFIKHKFSKGQVTVWPTE